MTKRSIQEINFPSDQERKSEVVAHKKHMPIIRCECGYEILVLPDLKAMNFAINKHVADHRKANDGSEKLTEFLTEQVMILASKMNQPSVNQS